MEFYRFLHDVGIHEIDYPGKIDLAEGLFRMDHLEKRFCESVSGGIVPLRILFDVRNAVWESAATHDALAKIAHRKFGDAPGGVRRYVAVVNNAYNSSVSGEERWFTDKGEAMDWLSLQRG